MVKRNKKKLLISAVLLLSAIILVVLRKTVFAPKLKVEGNIKKIVLLDCRENGYPKQTTITDEEIIREILDKLASLELKRVKKLPESSGGGYYAIHFYEEGNLPITGIDIHPDFINKDWYMYKREGNETELQAFLNYVIGCGQNYYDAEKDDYNRIQNGEDPLS